MGRPIKEILNSDINYFEKKVNKYKNQQITIKKELKELKKNSAQNVDAILKKLEYLDNLNNTVIYSYPPRKIVGIFEKLCRKIF